MRERIEALIRGHHKWKMFLYAAILLIGGVVFWLTQTNVGWIARNSWSKTFDTDTVRTVTAYSDDGTPIRRFHGTYSVEIFNDQYLVVMNQNTGERVNIYGDSAIVVDESPDYDHEPEGE